MSKKPKLSIIILSWNTQKLLEDCLGSISRGKGYEIIVVDNASADGSREFLKEQKGIEVIFNKKNLGFAKANNQGVKKASGEYTLLLNSDTVVRLGALEELLSYLEGNSEVLAVSPLLLNMDKSEQVEYYMRFPSPLRIFLYHNLLLRPLVMNTFLRYLVISKGEENKPFVVDQLPGAALMGKTKLLKRYPLDEDYSFLFEDVDWCYRIKQEGKGKLVVVPSAKIVHLGGGSWKQWLGEDRFKFYCHYFNSLFVFVKKHQSRKPFAYKLVLAFNFLINSLVHSIMLRFDRARVQGRLFFWVLTS